LNRNPFVMIDDNIGYEDVSHGSGLLAVQRLPINGKVQSQPWPVHEVSSEVH